MDQKTQSRGPSLSAFWMILVIVLAFVAFVLLRVVIGFILSAIIPALVIAGTIFVVLWWWNRSSK